MRSRLAALIACALVSACADSPAADRLEVFTSDAAGFDTHSFFYDTGREVVVFDAQFTEELAQRLISEIRTRTASPISYVVVTHPNPDKFNGVRPFQQLGAKVIASAATAQAIPGVHAYKKYYFTQVAKQFTEATYPPQAQVDITFSGRYVLPLQGEARVELQELQHAGVSSTQTVAYIPALAALLVGDLVHTRVHAWLEGGIVSGQPQPELSSWRAALQELSAYAGATVYGGRGDSAPVADAVRDQSAYLSTMEALITQYVNDLGARKSELSDPTLASQHYQTIAQRAQAAFPDYGLRYMLDYGVYGLVGAIASR